MGDRFLSALDQIGDLIFYYDRQLQILWANRAACRWAGKSRRELLGRKCYRVLHGRSRPCADCAVLQAMEKRAPVRVEKRSNGGPFRRGRALPFVDSLGTLMGVLEFLADAEGLPLDDQPWEDRQTCGRFPMEQMLDGVAVLDVRQKRIETVNRSLASLLGYSEEELRGVSLSDLLNAPPDEVEACLNRTIGALDGRVCEKRLRTKGGEEVPVEMTLNPIADTGRLCVVCRDLRPRKAREWEWLRVQRLEALGMLAGGIAHDFNNALAAILGNISLAKVSAEPGSRVYERLVNAESACFRAQAITRQLLTFATGGEPVRVPLDSAKLLTETVHFALSGSAVTAHIQTPEDLWPIQADEALVRQAIHQITLHGKKRAEPGGRIQVRAENVVIAQDREGLPAGRYVRFSFRDHGPALAREMVERLFDPYGQGLGAGIGLSVAHSVIRRHGGSISVNSQKGQGTEVRFFLPAAAGECAAQEGPRDLPGSSRTQGKVLVMDDEELVRETVGEMLRLLGFEVSLAREGSEAVAAYRRALESGAPYDVVVLDLTVPGGMGGQETLEALRSIHPGVRTIVSSGYCNDPVMARHRDYGFDGVVIKPYKVEDLAATIRRVMDDSGGAGSLSEKGFRAQDAGKSPFLS
ncbi:PAS domain S-box-containing protein [Desulfacinum hydrothermale DSM 13146]|uniref:histidine kinase n=1 Tax=Desulfacinum hydrothermale DSM 13146 TaxID=1121390 RepID=A0A1W1X770_9BACT|nr:PAS domain-containing sensor histidine kinase [Desulfacinum hydrothermale]SMC19657.1 PAS domain S-box-containing protein [Desulfacinum hydrothermale DSM 13146]